MNTPLPLFSSLAARFPSTRYQGSKAKLADWIWQQIAGLEFHTCLDAFGGTGAVAYRLKQAGKCVTYNDFLRFNYYIGRALIENNTTYLSDDDLGWILARHAEITYRDVIQKNFHDIYFTDEENAWLDQTIANIRQLNDPYKFALAFFALCQACIVKRPYNLFHRKNLYLRFAQVERSFGNKTSWDKSFEQWFRFFVTEANNAVFDNGQANHSCNEDAINLPNTYDLVYIDPPYISKRGVVTDYHHFYHFLEGLAAYDQWERAIDRRSKHRRLRAVSSEWLDKQRIHGAFERLFAHFQNSIIVVSYRSDGIPSESSLAYLLEQYKAHVRVEHFGKYQYALSKNTRSGEMLLIGS